MTNGLPETVKIAWETYCKICEDICRSHPDVMYNKKGVVVEQEEQWENEKRYRRMYFIAVTEEYNMTLPDREQFRDIAIHSIYNF